jgi:hypothetical protein
MRLRNNAVNVRRKPGSFARGRALCRETGDHSELIGAEHLKMSEQPEGINVIMTGPDIAFNV